MKCTNCGVEWNVQPSFNSRIDVCPFCGHSLKPKKTELSSLDGVLEYICQHFGIETLGDQLKLQSLFGDLAPKLKREKTMLRYFLECSGNEIFLHAVQESEEKALAEISKVMAQMENELLVSHDAVTQICQSFWQAIGGEKYDELPFNTPRAKQADSTPTVSEPVIWGKPEDILDHYLMHLVSEKIKPSKEECQLLIARGEKRISSHDTVDIGVKMLRFAADFGSHQAFIILGECYENGTGVQKDVNIAKGFYSRAAASGSLEAQYKLGVLHYCAREYYSAREWLKSAAGAGYRPAIDYMRAHNF